VAQAPKNVPEYAGGHLERMDGKGYPCDVFVNSEIYRKYTAEFLDAKQVDC
jgi:hypothetical protein